MLFDIQSRWASLFPVKRCLPRNRRAFHVRVSNVIIHYIHCRFTEFRNRKSARSTSPYAQCICNIPLLTKLFLHRGRITEPSAVTMVRFSIHWKAFILRIETCICTLAARFFTSVPGIRAGYTEPIPKRFMRIAEPLARLAGFQSTKFEFPDIIPAVCWGCRRF